MPDPVVLPGNLSETDPEQLQYIRTRALSDTGYLARTLLGYNYDMKGDRPINVGDGGVRPYGPHQSMVDFIDDEGTQFKLLMAPRKSLKSTIMQAYCVRRILLNPNIRILYGTFNDKKAEEFVQAIRNALERPEIVALFGDQRGNFQQEGRSWESGRFTVAGRTNTTLTSPTIRTFSLKTRPTGGRAEIIVSDDLIYEETVKSPEGIENSKNVFSMLFPLLEDGGTLVAVGTKYEDMDLYYELENNTLFKKLVLDAGVRVIQKKDGKLDLELVPGLKEPRFPNLTMDYLKKALQVMSRQGNWRLFSCQYLNVVPSGVGSTFKRSQFQPRKWRRDMMAMSGYLVTDTATSLQDEGCYSVLGYLLLDSVGNYYIADLRVGHFRPSEFLDHFFAMLQHWMKLCNHCGEVWERISMVTWAQSMIQLDPRSKQIRTRPIMTARSGAEQKYIRIDRLEPILRENRLFVLDTVPKKFVDLDGEKVLYDPDGFRDPRTFVKLPAGELVDEFIRLRAHPKRDIADALAMVCECNLDTGRPFCVFRQPSMQQRQQAGLTSPSEDRQNARVNPMQTSADWWDDAYRRVFGD